MVYNVPRLLLPTYFFQQPLTMCLVVGGFFGRWFFSFLLSSSFFGFPGGPGRAGETTSNKAGILGGSRSSPPFESPPIESRPRYTHKQARAPLCSQRSPYATSKGDEVSAPLGRRPAPVLPDPDCSSAKGSAEEVDLFIYPCQVLLVSWSVDLGSGLCFSLLSLSLPWSSYLCIAPS